MFDLDAFLRCGAMISTAPKKVVIGYGRPAWQKKPTGFSFFFPDFFLSNSKPWLVFEHTKEISYTDLLLFLNPDPRFFNFKWQPPEKSRFAKEFYELKALFAQGNLKKGVPFSFETANFVPNRKDLQYLLKNAINYARKHPAFLYGLWDERSGMIGATPELLFRLRNKVLETVACAGTCSKEERNLFLQDKKQQYEHDLVVESMVHSLSQFGSLTVEKKGILDLPAMCHLLTPMQLRLKKAVSLDQIIAALHPTPALGAFPLHTGRIWLKGLQKRIDRMRFGAPAGYCLQTGEAAFYVAIRNLQWKNGKMQIGAGCGVVASSQCRMEWEELCMKLQSIKKIFGLYRSCFKIEFQTRRRLECKPDPVGAQAVQFE